MGLIYDIGIRIYYLGILFTSLWNQKAFKWIRGRKNWQKALENKFDEKDKIIWFHCASLGEFEQGRPLIEKLSKECPEKKILLTFYSPSGYEKRKNFESVDYVTYLPLDTRRNARRIMGLITPEKVIFIKYEFWFRLLSEMNKRQVPLYLASGSFHKGQIFFKPWGGWFRKVLYLFDQLFVQDKDSAELLESIDFKNYRIAGDTRFDRVVRIADSSKGQDKLFPGDRLTLIAGSTWPEDEEIIRKVWQNGVDYNLVLAPHEPTLSHINDLKDQFPQHILYSAILAGEKVNKRIILVNTVGHLSLLYRFGSLAFIGGGFGKGIHNILEATAFGLPVMFGPNYQRFTEARQLIEMKVAHSVKNKDDLQFLLENYSSDLYKLKKESEEVKNYTSDHTGATSIIFESIFKKENP